MVINFTDLINSELKKQGISQLELAQKCGLTPQAICRYCKGQRVPNIYNADKVLTALGAKVILGKM